MGEKFCHLNVYGADSAAIAPFCPDFTVASLAPRWVTITGEALEMGALAKEARRLSKAVPQPVLSTEYFDGDFVEFALYREGKRVARHVPAEFEESARIAGSSKVWAEQLGASQETRKLLSAIFKETSPEISLHLLECALHCPLWVDREWMDAYQPPEEGYLEQYLAQKEAERHIKNQTELVLLDELAGSFGMYVTYPAVQAGPDGRKTFWDICDGKMRRLFSCTVPGDCITGWNVSRGEAGFLLSTQELDFAHGVGRNNLYRLSNQGEIVETFPDMAPGAVMFWGQDRIYISGSCWNFRTHKKEWDLNAVDLHTPVCFRDGTLATACYIGGAPSRENDCLVSVRPGDSQPHIVRVEGERRWSKPVVSGEELYLGCGKKILCYNSSLEKLWEAELEQEERSGGRDTPYLDETAQMLYIDSFRGVKAFDLRERKVTARRKNAGGEYGFLLGILPGMGPIVRTAAASLQVWDEQLTPISRHKVKGGIDKIVHQEGKTYLLSSAFAKDGVLSAESRRLYLYELRQA